MHTAKCYWPNGRNRDESGTSLQKDTPNASSRLTRYDILRYLWILDLKVTIQGSSIIFYLPVLVECLSLVD